MLICYHFPQFLGLSLINLPPPLRDDVIKRLSNQWTPELTRRAPEEKAPLFPQPPETKTGQIRYLCENTMTERPLVSIGLRECHLISHFQNEL